MSKAIEAKGFVFSYPGKGHTVGPIDWTVEEGSFTVLVGATGSGKTTLMRCCKPELAPVGDCAGELLVFGEPSAHLDARASAETVGYVAQNPENQIVCDAVWHEMAFGLENLGLSQDVMHRRVAEVAHFFGIEPWFRSQVSELSGGQKQMLNLASVLALRPRLLLLDEPTSQLDPVAEKNFLHALFRVNRELGLTVVVATHSPETMVDYATQCVRLEDGVLKVIDAEEFRVARLSQPPAPSPLAPPHTPDAVVVSDAYVRYARGAEFVLRGADLRVRAGSVHAIVGGNGSGKSTLLKLIAGVLSTERGRVGNRLASCQALLPQNPKTLFVCDTVEEELKEWQEACGYSDEDIARMLERFHLSHRVSLHPYDLSGGQQQLLAFAKLSLTNPSLYLMDEPTKGLDVPSKTLVAEAIVDAARSGATVLMVTHDLAFAQRVADTTSMLFDGEVTCTEPTGQFFAENLFYRPVPDPFYLSWLPPQGGVCA